MNDLASVGDSIECDINYPCKNTIRMKLITVRACAQANNILMDSSKGFRLVKNDNTKGKYQ